MLLVIDVGNSNIVFGVYHSNNALANKPLYVFRCATGAQRTSDEYILFFNHIMQSCGQNAANFAAVLMAVVVPDVVWPLRRALTQFFGKAPLLLNEMLPQHMCINTEQPLAVGVDRLLNVYAAWHLAGQTPVLTVDAGTAITFDIGNADGSFAGGIIAPGIKAMAAGLQGTAARLPAVAVYETPALCGLNTVTAMQSGLFYGTVALIDGIIARLLLQLPVNTQVFLTGGLMPLLRGHICAQHRSEDDLTLRAMVYYYCQHGGG